MKYYFSYPCFTNDKIDAQGEDVTCSKSPLSQPGLQPHLLSLSVKAMDWGTRHAFPETHFGVEGGFTLWQHCHLGPVILCWGGQAILCIVGYWAASPVSTQCFQTLPNVLWGQNCSQLRTTDVDGKSLTWEPISVSWGPCRALGNHVALADRLRVKLKRHYRALESPNIWVKYPMTPSVMLGKSFHSDKVFFFFQLQNGANNVTDGVMRVTWDACQVLLQDTQHIVSALLTF